MDGYPTHIGPDDEHTHKSSLPIQPKRIVELDGPLVYVVVVASGVAMV